MYRIETISNLDFKAYTYLKYELGILHLQLNTKYTIQISKIKIRF